MLLVHTEVAPDNMVWAFPVQPQTADATAAQAAVDATAAQTGVRVVADEVIGERTIPQNGRHMVYVACHPADGAGSAGKAAQTAWCTLEEFDSRVPPGIYPPVREHLQRVLTH